MRRKITPKMSKLDCWNEGYGVGWHERGKLDRRPGIRYGWPLFWLVVGLALGSLIA